MINIYYDILPKESDPLSIGISIDCCIRGAWLKKQ